MTRIRRKEPERAFTDHVVGPLHIDARSFGVSVGLHLNL
jgi:hypothetical protein